MLGGTFAKFHLNLVIVFGPKKIITSVPKCSTFAKIGSILFIILSEKIITSVLRCVQHNHSFNVVVLLLFDSRQGVYKRKENYKNNLKNKVIT